MTSSPPDVLQGVLPPLSPLMSPTIALPPSCIIKRKSSSPGAGTCQPGPGRKIHVSEDIVSRTMADLYISHPKAKVARRTVDSDVSQAMNVEALNGLESQFSTQANIANEDFHLPPQRTRKLPLRSKASPPQKSPQLRLSIHQELRNLRSCSAILPESLVSRYRPSPKSTAVVLWKPPGAAGLTCGVTHAQYNRHETRHRNRCFSEVTSTPYSSAENLSVDSEMLEQGREGAGGSALHRLHSPGLGPPCSGLPLPPAPGAAEAPDLSNYSQEVEVPLGVNLQRRNSAPEISDPLPFVDDCSMEL